jgi:excisionase family DNA binding protein
MHNVLYPAGLPPRSDKIRVHIAADIIGCSERTVRRYVETGMLSAERHGKRRWLLPRAEAEKLQRERGQSW